MHQTFRRSAAAFGPLFAASFFAVAAPGAAHAQPPAAAAPATPPASPEVVADRCRVILDQEAVLASDRPGILGFIEPGEGDFVSAGQRVAGLKDEVAVAALASAAAAAEDDVEIRFAQKATEVAEAEYAKSLAANKRSPGVIPEVELLRLKLSAEKAGLQIEKARLDLRVAELTRDEAAAELATYRITAPIDGVVTQVLKHAGEAVNQGDPILRIVATDAMRVEGLVSVADVFRLKPGDPVRVTFDAAQLDKMGVKLGPSLRDRAFEGKLSFVDVTANPVTGQVRVWATVRNPDGLLKAGLPAVMRIAPQAKAVPTGDSAATAAARPGR